MNKILEEAPLPAIFYTYHASHTTTVLADEQLAEAHEPSVHYGTPKEAED